MRIIKHAAALAALAACQPPVEYSDVGYYPAADQATATASGPESFYNEQDLQLAATEEAMRACPPPIVEMEPEAPSDSAAYRIASALFGGRQLSATETIDCL